MGTPRPSPSCCGLAPPATEPGGAGQPDDPWDPSAAPMGSRPGPGAQPPRGRIREGEPDAGAGWGLGGCSDSCWAPDSSDSWPGARSQEHSLPSPTGAHPTPAAQPSGAGPLDVKAPGVCRATRGRPVPPVSLREDTRLLCGTELRAGGWHRFRPGFAAWLGRGADGGGWGLRGFQPNRPGQPREVRSGGIPAMLAKPETGASTRFLALLQSLPADTHGVDAPEWPSLLTRRPFWPLRATCRPGTSLPPQSPQPCRGALGQGQNAGTPSKWRRWGQIAP